jgi:hypothetical protein
LLRSIVRLVVAQARSSPRVPQKYGMPRGAEEGGFRAKRCADSEFQLRESPSRFCLIFLPADELNA